MESITKSLQIVRLILHIIIHCNGFNRRHFSWR